MLLVTGQSQSNYCLVQLSCANGMRKQHMLDPVGGGCVGVRDKVVGGRFVVGVERSVASSTVGSRGVSEDCWSQWFGIATSLLLTAIIRGGSGVLPHPQSVTTVHMASGGLLSLA